MVASVGRAGALVMDVSFLADGLKRLEILREKARKLYSDQLSWPVSLRY